MYPFGSGTPNQHNQQSAHSSMPSAPFGAGFWVNPNQSSNPSSGCPYPGSNPNPVQGAPYPGANQAPYPGANQTPYPSGNQAPYPGASQAPYPGTNRAPYPGANQTPYPSANQAPYPGASQAPYPGASQAPYPGASQSPYPGANQASPYQNNPYGGSSQYPAGAYPHNTSSSPYLPSSTSAPYPSHTSGQPVSSMGYPHGGQQHGQGYPQNTYNTIAATNMAQCFNEMKHSNSSYQSSIKKGTPTVTPDPNFDANKDAHALRKAMKGFGTDEDTLINIICRRSNEQRQEIQRQYKTHFGKDLIEDIKSETSGNFENLLVGLLRPIVDFYCTELNTAMAGLGTDEDVLIEILCTLSNAEIHTIKNAYVRMYGAHLESELKSETSGNFKRLLVSLCCGARDESGRVDPVAAQHDAKELLNAGELRVGTDESMFNMVLCQRNYQQLKMILDEYANITGHSLEKAIKREFSGDIQEGLLAICKCVTNKSEYFASRLHKSMAGIGTNDQQLIRVVITRCEIDMQDIKVTFERMYGKSLKSWIKGDTSGHYKHALYALIGEQRSS